MEKAQTVLSVATRLLQFHFNDLLIPLSKMKGPGGLNIKYTSIDPS